MQKAFISLVTFGVFLSGGAIAQQPEVVPQVVSQLSSRTVNGTSHLFKTTTVSMPINKDSDVALILLFVEQGDLTKKHRFSFSATRTNKQHEVISQGTPNYVFAVPKDKAFPTKAYLVGEGHQRVLGAEIDRSDLTKEQNEIFERAQPFSPTDYQVKAIEVTEGLLDEVIAFADHLKELEADRVAVLTLPAEDRWTLYESAKSKIEKREPPTPQELAQYLAVASSKEGPGRSARRRGLTTIETTDGVFNQTWATTTANLAPDQVKAAKASLPTAPVATGWWRAGGGAIHVFHLYDASEMFVR